jgi:hypothetical protein
MKRLRAGRRTPRSRRRLAAVALVATATLTVAGCAGSGGGSGGAGGLSDNGNTATFAEVAGFTPNYIFPFEDPAHFGTWNYQNFSTLMFRPLLSVEKDNWGGFVPGYFPDNVSSWKAIGSDGGVGRHLPGQGERLRHDQERLRGGVQLPDRAEPQPRYLRDQPAVAGGGRPLAPDRLQL